MQASRYHGANCTKPLLHYDSIQVPAKGKIPGINDEDFGCSCSHCSKVNQETAHLTAVRKLTRNCTAVKLGDHVSVSGESGIVYYVGDLDSEYTNDKIFVGVQLHNPVGKHDGVFNRKRYFKCRPNRGVLLPLDEVQLLPNPKKVYSGLKFMKSLSASKKHNKADSVLNSKVHAQVKQVSCHNSTLLMRRPMLPPINIRDSRNQIDPVPKPASNLKKACLKNEHVKKVSFSDKVVGFQSASAKHIPTPPVTSRPITGVQIVAGKITQLSSTRHFPTPPTTPRPISGVRAVPKKLYKPDSIIHVPTPPTTPQPITGVRVVPRKLSKLEPIVHAYAPTPPTTLRPISRIRVVPRKLSKLEPIVHVYAPTPPTTPRPISGVRAVPKKLSKFDSVIHNPTPSKSSRPCLPVIAQQASLLKSKCSRSAPTCPTNLQSDTGAPVVKKISELCCLESKLNIPQRPPTPPPTLDMCRRLSQLSTAKYCKDATHPPTAPSSQNVTSPQLLRRKSSLATTSFVCTHQMSSQDTPKKTIDSHGNQETSQQQLSLCTKRASTSPANPQSDSGAPVMKKISELCCLESEFNIPQRPPTPPPTLDMCRRLSQLSTAKYCKDATDTPTAPSSQNVASTQLLRKKSSLAKTSFVSTHQTSLKESIDNYDCQQAKQPALQQQPSKCFDHCSISHSISGAPVVKKISELCCLESKFNIPQRPPTPPPTLDMCRRLSQLSTAKYCKDATTLPTAPSTSVKGTQLLRRKSSLATTSFISTQVHQTSSHARYAN